MHENHTEMQLKLNNLIQCGFDIRPVRSTTNSRMETL